VFIETERVRWFTFQFILNQSMSEESRQQWKMRLFRDMDMIRVLGVDESVQTTFLNALFNITTTEGTVDPSRRVAFRIRCSRSNLDDMEFDSSVSIMKQLIPFARFDCPSLTDCWSLIVRVTPECNTLRKRQRVQFTDMKKLRDVIQECERYGSKTDYVQAKEVALESECAETIGPDCTILILSFLFFDAPGNRKQQE
jgi:hypothetical protein